LNFSINIEKNEDTKSVSSKYVKSVLGFNIKMHTLYEFQ